MLTGLVNFDSFIKNFKFNNRIPLCIYFTVNHSESVEMTVIFEYLKEHSPLAYLLTVCSILEQSIDVTLQSLQPV